MLHLYIVLRPTPLTNSAFKMQRAMHRLRKVAARLGCRRAPDVAVPQQLGAGPSTAHVGGTSSSHGAHVGGTSSSHGAATSAEGGQGHGPYDDEGEHEGEDDEGQGEYYEHEYDEIGMSHLEDAPQGTQGPSGSGRPHRMLRPVDRYTPGTYPFGRGKRYAHRPR